MGKRGIEILNLNKDDLIRMLNEAPSDPYVEVILNQNLRGERCAIQRYQEIADFTNGKDHVTHQMATTILNEELEHEQDIEDWISDLERMKEDMRKLIVTELFISQ